MFVDKVDVKVKAGDGGNGIVSFRHEKFIEKGGPDGGDGGEGGDVVVIAKTNQDTLAEYRHHKLLKANNGGSGGRRKKHGKSADDLELKVPIGTSITDENGQIVVDMTKENQTFVIAKGGSGGFGNSHFTSSTRQAPAFSEKGEPGEEMNLVFELKMIADVGLIGLPNAGKSTLLGSTSNARPEIANYPFTTLKPNLGVVDIAGTSLLIADIPGLIEGASEGKGLGDDFLRHIERTNVLVHLIDVYENDVVKSYKTIKNELKQYGHLLDKKPEIVALNKIDGLDQDMIDDQMNKLKKALKRGTPLFAISAASKDGTKKLLQKAAQLAKTETKKTKKANEDKGLPVLRYQPTADDWVVIRDDDGFIVLGEKIEKFAQRTDYENQQGTRRLRDIMRKIGVMHELERKKINRGDKIYFGEKKQNSIEY